VCKTHDSGWGHPECADRYDAIFQSLCVSGQIDFLEKIPSRQATDEELLLCHTPAYIRQAHAEITGGISTLSTGDTEVSLASYDAALYAVGGVLNAADAVYERKHKNAFCLIRPPGHHATADRGMGFCIFNNAAIAARHVQKKYGVARVLIVDWDVHHGNGTQDIFYEDGSVFYFSTHQSPWYPGTGERAETGRGPGRGTTLNCPLPAGAGRDEIFPAFNRELNDAMEEFKPGFIIVSAGFDSRIEDPLGSFRLTDQDFYDLTRLLLDLAARHCEGRLLSILEGGYNLAGLALAATSHVSALVEG